MWLQEVKLSLLGAWANAGNLDKGQTGVSPFQIAMLHLRQRPR